MRARATADFQGGIARLDPLDCMDAKESPDRLERMEARGHLDPLDCQFQFQRAIRSRASSVRRDHQEYQVSRVIQD